MGLRRCSQRQFHCLCDIARRAKRVPGEAHPSWGRSQYYVPRWRASAPASQAWYSKLGSRITLLASWESSRLHRFIESSECVQHATSAVNERACKLWAQICGHAQEILNHEYLSVASHAGADADGRNPKTTSNFLG